ncbi:helix-turn-helix domain-containing protein [Ralstonia syzygii]|uniref:helix-turn-helix domain-containing protein n=1 Tax=Ralstonia syzygii TaxID=28097 RepID=UPI0036F2621D
MSMDAVTRYAALGERIRSLRTAVGIATQAELALQLGASQQTVSRWEAGTSRPRANDLAKLAAVLKVDVMELSHAAGYAPEVTTVSFDRPLPLPSLLPDSFEYFCLDLLSTHLQGMSWSSNFGQADRLFRCQFDLVVTGRQVAQG